MLDRPGLIQRLMNNAKIAGTRQAENYGVHKLTDKELRDIGLELNESGYMLISPHNDIYTVC